MDLQRWKEEEEEAEIEKRTEHKAMWDPLKQLLMLQNHRQAVATLFPNLTPWQETRLRALLKMPPSPPSPSALFIADNLRTDSIQVHPTR